MTTTRIHSAFLDSKTAGADLTGHQFKFVRFSSTGELVACGDGEVGFVLQDKPARGQPGSYATGGMVKAVAGGNIAANDPVASDASSRVIRAATGDCILGYATVAAASGELAQFHFYPSSVRAA